MATRPNATPLIQRVQVGSNIQAPGLEVTAQPVNVVGQNNADEDRLARLQQSLGEFTGSFNRFADTKTKELIQQEVQAGELETLTTYDPANQPTLTTDQTAWYQEARMSSWGARKGTDLAANMLGQYEDLKKNKPREFAAMDFRTWSQKYIADSLQGLEDPDVIKGIAQPLAQASARIQADAPAQQQSVRDQELLSDYGQDFEVSTVASNFDINLINQKVLDAKTKGIAASSVVPFAISTARYGLTKGNYQAASILDTPLPALNGLTLRNVANVKDQDNIDALLGKKPSAEERGEQKQFLLERSGQLFSDAGFTTEAVDEVANAAMRMKLSKADAAAAIVSGVEGLVATGRLTPEQAAIELNKKRAVFDGVSIRNASAAGDRSSADTLASKAITEQKRLQNEALTAEANAFEAKYRVALSSDNPEAAGIDLSDQGIEQATIRNPRFKGGQTGVSLYVDAYKVRNKAQATLGLEQAYNSGLMRTRTDISDEQKRKAALSVESKILTSGLTKNAQISQMVALGVQNNIPSPTLSSLLGNVRTMPTRVKDEQGKEVLNPELQSAVTTLDAIRKSANPQALSQYATGDDLVFLNALDVRVNELGQSLETAANDIKTWTEPTKAAQLKSMVSDTKSKALDQVMHKVNTGVDNGGQFIFSNARIDNPQVIRSYADAVYPQYLAAAGGNVNIAVQGMSKDIDQRVIVVTNRTQIVGQNNGYAIILPPGTVASKEIGQAFQTFHDAKTKQYASQGAVNIIPTRNFRGDTEYTVYAGLMPMENASFSDLVNTQRDAKAQAALDANLRERGLNQQTRDFATGKITQEQLTQRQNAQIDANVARLRTELGFTDVVGAKIQGNPNGPVMKGTGPRDKYTIATQAADEDPGFAIGIAAEGMSAKAYKDNDGGITLGVGYNTKHQSPEQLRKDFSNAGLPSDDIFIANVKNGNIGLTLPQMKSLHSVAFKRYQGEAKKVMDSNFPGAWDKMNVYQQAAMGQLAYNTGWNSSTLKKFMGLVAQGREEEAIANLRITYRDSAGNQKVNTDMMRLIRGMYDGPQAFKSALSMG